MHHSRYLEPCINFCGGKGGEEEDPVTHEVDLFVLYLNTLGERGIKLVIRGRMRHSEKQLYSLLYHQRTVGTGV